MKLITLACVLTLAVSVRGDSGSQSAPTSAGSKGTLQNYYYFHDTRMELKPYFDRIAVFTPGKQFDAGQIQMMAGLGFQISSISPAAADGWQILKLGENLATSTGVNSAIEKLSASNDVAFASPVFRGNDGGWIIVTPDVLVRFEREFRPRSGALLDELAQDLEVVEENFGAMSGAFRLKSSFKNGYQVLAQTNRLAQDPRVDWAEPDMQFTGREAFIPNDPGFGNIWGITNTGQFGGIPDKDMDGDSAWDVTTGCATIKVLIIDVGVQQDHPDINQLPGENFNGEGGQGGPINSCDNHGTAVAGCVSAIINNSLGTVGIAPDCKSISAKPFVSNVPCDGGWSSSAARTVNALAWAQTQGVRVTNNSNYYGFTSSSIDDKYSDTRDSGMVHFASAGNFDTSIITYPASLPSVNAVAALTPTGALASFSNWGVGLAFSAPGTNVYSTDRTGGAGYISGDYVYVQGTSFASPYSAGVAALILSQDPGLTAAQVETIMNSSCVDLGTVGYDTTYGWGFVNANNAVLATTLADADVDGTGDACDICPATYNPLQEYILAGDANGDDNRTLADIISDVNYLFNKPGWPACASDDKICWLSDVLCRGDWNGSNTVALDDVVRGVNSLFNKPGGPWDAIPVDICCIVEL
ncbi:MAG: S8 family serine peptidase [candidate division Zixibacteria bacterium]|nr:S8 family serine peptidase [candidate division Zixibacteria bacterium]